MNEPFADHRERLLDIQGVADICRLSEKTVRRMIKAGDLPATRLGRRWRIRPRDLEDFIGDRLKR